MLVCTGHGKCLLNQELTDILSSERKIRNIIVKELKAVADKYGHERKTTLVFEHQLAVEAEEEDVVDQLQMVRDIQRMYQVYEECLSEKEKLVIRLRYGICGCQESTQKEIAEKLGISRSYVSRIEKAALLKMRAAMS